MKTTRVVTQRALRLSIIRKGKVKLPCRGWIKHSDSRDHVGEMDDRICRD